MPLEYTGTALEKLMGFLIAIIILAIVLTAANLIALTLAIDVVQQFEQLPFLTLATAGLIFVPLWYVASYRARRYLLSRTRWRGIRMAMSPGGWGYAWRACLYGALNILSLGLLWPLKTYRLEKFLTDRSWYGNERFTQHGGFGQLYGPILPFLVCIWGSLALLGYIGWEVSRLMSADVDFLGAMALLQGNANVAWASWAIFAFLPLSLLFGLYYRVASIRVLVSYKTLGDGVEFDIYPRTRSILRIYILGGLKTAFAVSLVSPIVLGLFLGVIWLFSDISPQMLFQQSGNLSAAAGLITAIVIFLLRGVFRQIMIVYPLVKHFAESFELHNPALVEGVRQRDKDQRTDGGGFAEALGAGGAF